MHYKDPRPRRFEAVSGVYALIDPRTDRVMYVGQSVDIDYRYRQHCNLADFRRSDVDKYRWVEELDRLGMMPTLAVLERCDWPDTDEIERAYIAKFKATGQCELNIASGGAGAGVSRLKNSHVDDWFQLGLKIKAARAILDEIRDDAGKLAGSKYIDRMFNLILSLDRFKWKLEEIVSARFPDWQYVSQLFSGPVRGPEFFEGPNAGRDDG